VRPPGGRRRRPEQAGDAVDAVLPEDGLGGEVEGAPLTGAQRPHDGIGDVVGVDRLEGEGRQRGGGRR
jgi:hypothetical protein